MIFENEQRLTEVFDRALFNGGSPFSPKRIAKEFDYREGRTDVIMVDDCGDLLAFEMKLVKWKQAFRQAYKNLCFADFSYVVLPGTAAKKAIKYEHYFNRHGIGLCSVEGENIKVEITAKRMEPLNPWLSETAFKYSTEVEYAPSGQI